PARHGLNYSHHGPAHPGPAHLAHGSLNLTMPVDHPVLLWDADGWEPDWGQDPHDGLRYAASSLRQWLWTWADGGNVWDEALALPD
ncbi:hypothetical protein ACPB9H_33440, partial [Streptomyces cinereoruber]